MTTLWVGGNGGMEASLVQRAGLPFEAIPAAGVHGVGLRSLPGNLLQLVRGVAAARRILARLKPDVLFFTGGYVAAPMAVAAGNIPSVLYVPDIEPGMALKFLSRTAHVIAVTADDSRRYFSPGKVHVTGYPVRADLKQLDKTSARQSLGLDTSKKTLLVFGGSKGARSINRALLSNLQAVLAMGIQIVHISGELDHAEVSTARNQLPTDLAASYHLYPYLHEEMGAALAAADLVISRAGASALGEYPLFSLPSILVPYPYAWRYQKVNADYLVSHGAAVMVVDDQLAGTMPLIVQQLITDPQRLENMGHAAASLAHPDAAAHIASLIMDQASGGQHG